MAWQITHAWGYEADLAKSSEVEVHFTPQPDGTTLVELEHRYFERMGAGGAAMRAAVGAPNRWTGVLQLYVEQVEKGN